MAEPVDSPPLPTLTREAAVDRHPIRGMQALWVSTIGYVVPGLFFAGAFFADIGGASGAILGFFGFPLAQFVALVMGLMALRSNTGRVAVALAAIGLAGWGWLFYLFLSRPLIKLF